MTKFNILHFTYLLKCWHDVTRFFFPLSLLVSSGYLDGLVLTYLHNLPVYERTRDMAVIEKLNYLGRNVDGAGGWRGIDR